MRGRSITACDKCFMISRVINQSGDRMAISRYDGGIQLTEAT